MSFTSLRYHCYVIPIKGEMRKLLTLAVGLHSGGSVDGVPEQAITRQFGAHYSRHTGS